MLYCHGRNLFALEPLTRSIMGPLSPSLLVFDALYSQLGPEAGCASHEPRKALAEDTTFSIRPESLPIDSLFL